MGNAFDVSSANRLFLIRESIDQGMFAEHVDYTRDPYRVAIDALMASRENSGPLPAPAMRKRSAM